MTGVPMAGLKSMINRIISKANVEVVKRIAAAPTVAANASEAVGMEALIQAVRKEDAKVTIEVAPRLQVRPFWIRMLLGACFEFPCLVHFLGRRAGALHPRGRPCQQVGDLQGQGGQGQGRYAFPFHGSLGFPASLGDLAYGAHGAAMRAHSPFA